MATQDPSQHFGWDTPDVGGDFDVWGNGINVILADDGPDSIDSILFAVQTTANAALPATGGTITGDLTLSASGARTLAVRSTDGAANLNISRGSTSNIAGLTLQHNQVSRWSFRTTANADADFQLLRFDDAGASQGAAISIDRGTGSVTIPSLTVVGLAGDGSALTNLNASNIASGTLADARLPEVIGSSFNRQFEAQFGSAALPSIRFGGDPDLGLFREAANSLGVSAAGVQRLRISSSVIQALSGAVFTGDGGGLTNIPAANLTGQINPGSLPATVSATRFSAGNGDLSNPAYRFTSAQSTGMSLDTDGNVSFSRLGSNKFEIQNSALVATGGAAFTGDGSGLTGLNASQLLTGTAPLARIPNLPASKTNSGTFGLARIPDLPASKTTSGTFAQDRIPSLSATKITSDQLGNARLPSTIDQTNIRASGALRVGGGTDIQFVGGGVFADPFPGGLIGAHTTVTGTVNVTGAQTNDLVFASVRNSGTGSNSKFHLNGQVTSAGVVTLTAENADGLENAFTASVHVLVVRF